jgi:hypothetical protein
MAILSLLLLPYGGLMRLLEELGGAGNKRPNSVLQQRPVLRRPHLRFYPKKNEDDPVGPLVGAGCWVLKQNKQFNP